MAVLRVKRGVTTPTTSNLSYVGELAFDYNNNVLYARNSTSVVKIGGEMERVYFYEGSVSSHSFLYTFSPNFIYKIVVIASTTPTTPELSPTYIYYLQTGGGSNLSGSYTSLMVNDVNTTTTRISAKNVTGFMINDEYSNSVTPTYAYTKMISFEFCPTSESSPTSHYQWVAHGSSICTASDQSNPPITHAMFAHSVNGPVYGLNINPGLDIGTQDSISVAVFRIARK